MTTFLPSTDTGAPSLPFPGPGTYASIDKLIDVDNMTRFEQILGPLPQGYPDPGPLAGAHQFAPGLPAAYIGQNHFLESVVLQMSAFIGKDIQELAPSVITDQLSIVFSQIKFGPDLTGSVPHGTLPRLIGYEERSGKAGLQRNGIGMRLEHDFCQSPKGRRIFFESLRAMGNAVANSIIFDIILGLRQIGIVPEIHIPEPIRNHAGFVHVARLLRNGVDEWYQILKSRGLPMTTDASARHFARIGAQKPDSILMPHQIATYLNLVDPEGTTYAGAGREGYARVENNRPIATFQGLKVYVVDMHSDLIAQNIDPMTTTSAIGEYYLPKTHIGNEYHTDDTAIQIYDEDNDCTHVVRLETMLENSHVFTDDETGSLDDSTYGDTMPFLAHPDGTAKKYIGELSDKDLPENTLLAIVRAIVHLAKRQNPSANQDEQTEWIMEQLGSNTGGSPATNLEDGDGNADDGQGLQGASGTPSSQSLGISADLMEFIAFKYDIRELPIYWKTLLGEDASPATRAEALVRLYGTGAEKERKGIVTSEQKSQSSIGAPPAQAILKAYHADLMNEMAAYNDIEYYTDTLGTWFSQFTTRAPDLAKGGAIMIHITEYRPKLASYALPIGIALRYMAHLASNADGTTTAALPSNFNPQYLNALVAAFNTSRIASINTEDQRKGLATLATEYAQAMRSMLTPVKGKNFQVYSSKKYNATQVRAPYVRFESLLRRVAGDTYVSDWNARRLAVAERMKDSGTLDGHTYHAYLSVPLTRGALQDLLWKNIPLPFTFVLFRPNCSYRTLGVTILARGSQTAFMARRPGNFNLSYDASAGYVNANYTAYTALVVPRRENIQNKHFCFPNGYLGGRGVRFYDKDDTITTQENKSMFAAPLTYPEAEKMRGKPIDFTGKFTLNHPHCPNNSILENQDGDHYSFGPWMKRQWGVGTQVQDETATINTVMFMGTYKQYNSTTSSFSDEVRGNGHMATLAAPGTRIITDGHPTIDALYDQNMASVKRVAR